MLTHVTSGLDPSLSLCVHGGVRSMPIPSSSLPYLPHSSRVSGTHSWIGWRWAVRCAIGGIELPSVSASSFQCFITPRLSASSVESHKDLQTYYRQRSLVPSHSFPLSGISPQLQKGRSFTNVFSASTHTLSLSYTQKKRKDYITSYLMDFVKPLLAGLSFALGSKIDKALAKLFPSSIARLETAYTSLYLCLLVAFLVVR